MVYLRAIFELPGRSAANDVNPPIHHLDLSDTRVARQ